MIMSYAGKHGLKIEDKLLATILTIAAVEKYQQLVDLVFTMKPTLTAAFQNVLYIAIEAGDEQLLEALLQRGLQPNDKINAREHPLIVAAHTENLAMIEQLLKAGQI
ncbi:ankyrin repeat domain-containing protein [Bacillus sp. N9]